MAKTFLTRTQEEGAAGPAKKTRKPTGGKLSRSVTVTVRLDPKLHYLAELAGRKYRRTLSSFIEWAVQDAVDRVVLSSSEDGPSLGIVKEDLWDVDEADRFAKLALRYPELLTHGEQILWKLIRENGYVWRGRFSGPNERWTWRIAEDSLNFSRLRDNWATFKAVAELGPKEHKGALPTWNEYEKPAQPAPSAPDAGDDDIPF